MVFQAADVLRESLTLPGIGQVDSATREQNLQYLKSVRGVVDSAVVAMIDAVTTANNEAGKL